MTKMSQQTIFSLAIQALFERRDSIQRRTPQNLPAIQECEEAIEWLKFQKELSRLLEDCICGVDIRIDSGCGDKIE